jgi:hypothetical protein
MKIFCPLYGGECHGDECVVWGKFYTVNQQTGKPTGDDAGEGCQWFNKVLKQRR